MNLEFDRGIWKFNGKQVNSRILQLGIALLMCVCLAFVGVILILAVGLAGVALALGLVAVTLGLVGHVLFSKKQTPVP